MVVALVLSGCSKNGDELPTTAPTGTTPTGTGGGGWSEANWCGGMDDLSAIEAAHDASRLRQTLVEISEARYPPAVGFIDAQSDSELSRWFFGGTASFDSVMDGYEVAVHEGSHIWGFDFFSFDSYSYRIVDDDLIIETAYLDNFFRAEILDRHPYPNSDFYADTYLTGQSGNQGFNTLLDEFNAYAHSLASRYCTRDTLGNGSATSARDGTLTFMLYVELYLKIAREDHSADYDAIVGDAPTVEAILSVWDRSEYLLDLTEDSPELGIDDAKIAGFVYEADNLAEIERLR